MVEDVSLDKLTVLDTLQCQCVAPIGVHHNELGIMFLVEVAILGYELIVILVKVFAQMFGRLMVFRFVVIELLVCLGQGYIQHRTFLLFRLDIQWRECGAIFANI